jgi:hypothetical protein
MGWIFNRKAFAGCVHRIKRLNWLKALLSGFYLLVGLLALLWFLIRVIPKPSRAMYPCQRAAFPIASSFVIYMMGLAGVAVAFNKANHRFKQSRYWLAGVCAAAGFVILFFTISKNPDDVLAKFVPADLPNSPIGSAKGIFPGRVVWVHDPNVTSWDGQSNYWWDDNHTNPAVIESMITRSVCWLTQKQDAEGAWELLFRHYNKTHNRGDRGYSRGEFIVIKPNHNNQASHSTTNGVPDTPPAVYVALLKHLVYNAGIDPNCIIISESSRYIDDKTYNACFAMFPQVRYEETNYYLPENNPGTKGRQKAEPVPDMIKWSSINPNTGQPISNYPLAKAFVQADYVINLARMQGHGEGGATLCAKNWYGCFCLSPEYDSTLHSGNVLHNLLYSPQYNRYSPLVDLMGHQYLGNKTVLYILDGLWGFEINWMGYPTRFTNTPFNRDYPSSILVSQDPVAIDSVALDFLAAQFDLKNMPIDSYLHEAALANNPPSQTRYDPEGDGTRLGSLGSHEHWNNAVEKKYSRNLGTGNGIELIYISPQTGNYHLPGDFNLDGIVNEVDLKLLSDQWLTQTEHANWDSSFDIAPIGGDGKIDIQDFIELGRNWKSTDCGAYFSGDFNRDCRVNLEDLNILASAWLSEPGQPGWDNRCDILPAIGDNKIDVQDFTALSMDWMNAYCKESFDGDFNQNCRVGTEDMALLAVSWLSEAGQPSWDERCDIRPVGGDGRIDIKDFYGLSIDWLMQKN